MPVSMTGFSRFAWQGSGGQLTWEIRCINHRYLEMVFKLPEAFKILEPQLRERVKAEVQRGRLEAILHWCPNSGSDSGIQLNESLINGLFKAYELVARRTGSNAMINPMDILHWPEVVIRSPASCEEVCPEVLASFRTALESLNTMRQQEGCALTRILIERAERMVALMETIRTLLPQALVLQREKLVARLDAIAQQVDANRLEQELVFFAQKIDVSEEVDRLDIHIQEFLSVLAKGKGAAGRRLDFLAQELSRETNTLSAKNTHPEISTCVLELKILIEQLREQIQNVE